MTRQERAALVDQLRHWPHYKISLQILKATYEIEDLAQQVATLRTALEPFADRCDEQLHAAWEDGDPAPTDDRTFHVKMADLRRARAALAQTEPKVTT